MRVLLLCNKFPFPAKDGSSIALMRMIDTMLEAKMEVDLFSLNTLKHFKDPQQLEAKYGDRLNVYSHTLNTNINAGNTLVNLIGNEPFHVSRFFNKVVEKEIAHILEQNEFDIIQFEGIFMSPYLDVVRKYSKAKCVLRPHNVEYKIWERFIKVERNVLKNIYLSIQTKRLKAFEIEYARRFDGIATISEADAIFFKKHNHNKVESIVCGINTDEYPNLSSEKNNFFHLGAMDWMPNISGIEWFLKEVWPLVLAKLPEANFTMGGHGMNGDFLKLKQNGVTVLKEVESAESFYRENGIMIVPLLSGSGIRIKIIEGLSYGKAIISTSVGAEGIQVKNEENILLRDAPEDFAEAMVELYENREKRIQLGKNARDLATSTFDLKTLGQKLTQFYKTLN